jgi:putative endonuclease
MDSIAASAGSCPMTRNALNVIPAKAGTQYSAALRPYASRTGDEVGQMKDVPGYVYVLASGIGGTLYIGVTSDLPGRVFQHKSGAVDGFTKTYKVDRLVYYEAYQTVDAAIQRERRMKKWNRKWKVDLIEKDNPNWIDLYPGIATP